MTQDEIIAYLVRETQIQKNSTVRRINKLKSRSDPRESSAYIGLFVSGALGTLLFLVIVSDLPKVCQHLKAALTGRRLIKKPNACV